VVERGATLLLGIGGLAVERVELLERGARVAHVVTADETAAACPSCGVVSTSVKGHATTRPRTSRTGGAATAGVAQAAVAVPGAGVRPGVTGQLAKPLPPVSVLGIDETRRGKPKWEQDQDSGRWRIAHDRWHTGIVDAAGTGGLLAHIDGRTAASVTQWLLAQPDAWRAGVTHVTIDLSASYAKAVADALPDAVVVADRFHLVRLANDMVTEVRQHATRQVRGRRGRKRDPNGRAGGGC
jgi:transposase